MRCLLSLVFIVSIWGGSAWAIQCPPGICPVIEAHLMPGANAGLKIEASITALPAAGGYVDATGFPNPQTLTGFTIRPGVTVKLGPVFHTLACGKPITVNQGGRLIGSGANNPGATYIKLFNNCNHDVIEVKSTAGSSNWWHWGEVSWIYIIGNKQNNKTGNGISVYRMGEGSIISHLNISESPQSGMYITGSQSGTQSIENVTVNTNGQAGIRFDGLTSALYLKSVGGDRNPITFHVLNANNSGGAIYITAPKSESPSSVTPSVIVFEGGNSPTLFSLAGGNLLGEFNGKTQKAITILPGTKNPFITIRGTVVFNVGAIVDDRVNNVIVTPHDLGVSCENDSICRVMDFQYHAGQWSSFPVTSSPCAVK